MSATPNEWGASLRQPPPAMPSKPPFVDPYPNWLAELKVPEYRGYLVYKAEPKPNGGMTKIPFNTRGLKCNDRSQDVSYAEMAAFLSEHKGEYAGGGIHINGDLLSIDIDNCVDPESGDVEPWAAKIILKYPEMVWVLSPSKRGVHGFCRGVKTGKRSRSGRIECYSSDSLRFLTVTDDLLPMSSKKLNYVDISDLCARINADEFN